MECVVCTTESKLIALCLQDPDTGPVPALFSYLTIKVLFWDIGVSLGDTITDFCQGLALLFTPGKEVYGIITLAINWVPGIPAAVHLFSMYRFVRQKK